MSAIYTQPAAGQPRYRVYALPEIPGHGRQQPVRPQPPVRRRQIDMVAIAGGLFLLILVFAGLGKLTGQPLETAAAPSQAETASLAPELAAPAPTVPADVTGELTSAQAVGGGPALAGGQVQLGDPGVFLAPYDSYVLTQGLHGVSYGHMAIDIAAGNGAAIKSPISGQVTAVYVDEYNNTTLIIENDRYQILMLHGNYTVQVGEIVAAGQQVGTESNNGYTLDQYGRLCAGRDCGYHTHLNFYDKQLGDNVNPLDLIQ